MRDHIIATVLITASILFEATMVFLATIFFILDDPIGLGLTLAGFLLVAWLMYEEWQEQTGRTPEDLGDWLGPARP